MKPLLEVGGLQLPAYGLVLLVALAAGVGLTLVEAGRLGFRRRDAWDGARWVILGALLGAHLPYLVLALVQRSPGIARGATYVGALAGAILALVAYVTRRRLDLRLALDAAAPAAALGHAIGRVGCFLAGCCWGAPTTLGWAVTFRDERCPAPTGVPLHPTQLLEAGLELLVLAILWRRRRRPHRPGSQALLYGISYGVIRVGVETLRADPGRGRLAEGLTVTQAMGVVLAAACAGAWILLARRDVSRRAA